MSNVPRLCVIVKVVLPPAKALVTVDSALSRSTLKDSTPKPIAV